MYIFKVNFKFNIMKNLIIIFLFFIAFSSRSQDQLFKKDNSKLNVKILEISTTEIKYKLFNYIDGPTISLLKSEVALIIYQNGVHEVIATEVVQNNTNLTQTNNIVTTPDQYKDLISTKHLISINIMEPLNGMLGISYLHEFKGNHANVFIPVSLGITQPYMNQSTSAMFFDYNRINVSDYRLKRKIGEIGIGFNFQTEIGKSSTYFLGPYIGIAQYTGTFNEITNYTPLYSSTFVPPTTEEHSFILNRSYFMFNNGVLYRFSKNFNIILNAALGIRQETFLNNNPETFYKKANSYTTYYNNSFPINAFKLGLSFGYRF